MLIMSVFVVSLLGGMLPVISADVYLTIAAAAAAPALLPLMIVASTVGQALGKLPLYAAGWRIPGAESRGAKLSAAWQARMQRCGTPIVFLSACLGIPPLFAIAFAAGGMRLPFAQFLTALVVGRLIHAAALASLPHLVPRMFV